MKIALVAPLEESIPPKKYGGIEWIVYHLAHGLGKKGHKVDLYATGDSQKEDIYTLIPVVEKSLRTDPIFGADPKMREAAKMYYLSDTLEMLQNRSYDIIHNHAGWRFLSFSNLLKKPIITTHHGPLSLPYQQFIFRKYKNYPYVAISENQKKDLADINYVATIYNGVDTQIFHPVEDGMKQTDLLFFARFSHEKGGLEAIQVAKNVGKKLVIGAKVDLVDQDYFAKAEPLIDQNLIEFIGEVDHKDKSRIYSNARALLAPIRWEEPFGLMFTESMSCGTPVVAFSRGSSPEIIRDGVTGFLVNESPEYIRGDFVVQKTGVEGLCEAVKRIYALSEREYQTMREQCRNHVVKNFSAEKMVSEYEEAFEKVLSHAV